MSGGEPVTAALSTPGVLLESHAAGFERLLADCRRRGLRTPGTTDRLQAMRSYADQVYLWNQYMTTSWSASNKDASMARKWNGQTYYRRPGCPSVAVPGTSNHGNGDTVDWQSVGTFGSADFAAFAPVAAEHGWNNREGASIGEPWHWTRVNLADLHRYDPPPAQPTTPEDDDMTLILRAADGAQADAIFPGWSYIVEAGHLRALDSFESQARAEAGQPFVNAKASDINGLAHRIGLWEFTGGPSTGPTGLTGRLIGATGATEVGYVVAPKHFPITEAPQAVPGA